MSVVKYVHVRWHHDSHENNDQVADIGEKDVKVGVEEPGRWERVIETDVTEDGQVLASSDLLMKVFLQWLKTRPFHDVIWD